MLILYISAVVVALVLRHQERRHQMELARLYEILGAPMPTLKPKLHRNEAWTQIVLGTLLAIAGSLSLATNIAVMKELEVPQEQWEFSAVMLATGITLFFLGDRSLKEHKKYERALRDQSST